MDSERDIAHPDAQTMSSQTGTNPRGEALPLPSSSPAPTPTRASFAPKPLDLFDIVLHDDDEHTYDYVIALMQKVFACEAGVAIERAKAVDTQGRVVCMTTHKELAELKRDQIHAFGPDRLVASCQGSMSATIEPARAS